MGCHRLPGIIAALALGAGCTAIGTDSVPGWPALRVVEHHVPHPQMRERCARYVAAGMSPEACAEIDFERGLCHIWLSADFPPHELVLRHERLHCEGFENKGDDAMARLLARYRARDSGARPARPPQ